MTRRISLLFFLLIAQAGCAAVAPRPVSGPPEARLRHDLAPPRTTVCRRLAPSSGTTCTVQGHGQKLLIRGDILAPDEILIGGEVLIAEHGEIEAVGCDVSTQVEDGQATSITCPRGVVSPGLINLHDHLQFDQNPPGNWGDERFDNRHQWRMGLDGHTRIAAPRAENELQVAWAELRQLMAGTTSVASSGGHRGLLRNLDVPTPGQSPQDRVLTSVFPLGDQTGLMLVGICDYPRVDHEEVLQNRSYIAHVAEGINAAAHNELLCLNGGRVVLTGPNSAFVHALATSLPEARALAESRTAVIWSPRSNLSLYGNTAAVTLLARLGVRIALSSDWTPSGSAHLLRELECAASFNERYLDGFFSAAQLWRMVTAGAADAARLTDRLGALRPGALADLAVFRDDGSGDVHRALLQAGAADVELVLVGGRPVYGDAELMAALGTLEQRCERLPFAVCGTSKVACLEREIGVDFATLQRAAAGSYGLFFCGKPPGEPTCVPSRPGEYTGRIRKDDLDGDGLTNGKDNCPRIFNPVRPMDAGLQADGDGDGIGDLCDPCPAGDCPSNAKSRTEQSGGALFSGTRF